MYSPKKVESTLKNFIGLVQENPRLIVCEYFIRLNREISENGNNFTPNMALIHQLLGNYLHKTDTPQAKEAMEEFKTKTQDLRQRRPFMTAEAQKYDLFSTWMGDPRETLN